MRAIFALSRADKWLFLEALATVVQARLGLRLCRFESLRYWSSRLGSGARPIDRVVWATSLAIKLNGTSCLAACLALQRLLGRNGHRCEIRIGVTKQDGSPTAHAWVVCDGKVLLDTDDHSIYTPLASWLTVEPVQSGTGQG